MVHPVPGHYRFRLFGRPRLERMGEGVVLSRFQRALLALVCTGERRVSRSKVVDLLWDGGEEALRRRRLSQLLYDLSGRVGDRLIEGRGDDLLLTRELLATDLDRFEAALANGEWEVALAMVEVGFLRGLVPPGRAYEEWIEDRDGEIRGALMRALHRSWEVANEVGDWRSAAEVARAQLRLNPDGEAILRRALRATVLAADVDGALAIYEEWKRRGLEPADPRTRALLERLRAGPGGGATLLDSPEPARGSLGVPPFIGREEELRAIKEASGFAGSRMATVAVLGEAGAGKTRLAREAFQRARAQGLVPLVGVASELESCIALGPIAEILTEDSIARAVLDLEEPWSSVLRSLIPRMEGLDPGVPPSLDPKAVPRRLFESLLRLFQVIGERAGGVLLIIDDLQWADETTLGALEFVRKRWSGPPGVLLVTAREEALAKDSPPWKLIESLRRESRARILRLPPLDEEKARTLTDWFLRGREATESGRRRIVHLAQGNPLFLVELARLRARADGGGASARDGFELPESLMDVLRRRLNSLTPLARDLLEVLAVRGRPTRPAILAGILEISESRIYEGLDVLERNQVVDWRESRVALHHPLLSRAVRRDMTAARSRWLHGRTAEVLRENYKEEAAGQLAVHFHEAGRGEEALHYAVLAADCAANVGAYPEAAHLLDLALDYEADPDRALTLRWRRAEMNFLAARYSAAGKQFRNLAEALATHGDDRQAAKARLRVLELSSRRRASLTPELFRELAQIRERALAEDEWSTLVDALESEFRALDGAGRVQDIDRLLPILRRVLHDADEDSRARALPTGAIAELLYGDHTRALDLSKKGMRKCSHDGMGQVQEVAYSAAWLVFICKGILNTGAGRALVREIEEASERQGDPYSRYSILLNRANWHLTCGDLVLAKQFLNRTREFIVRLEMDEPATSPRIWYNLGTLSLAAGRCDEARSDFQVYADSRDASVSFDLATAQACLGLCDLLEGNFRAAMEVAEQVEPFLNHPALVSRDPIPLAELHARIAMGRNNVNRALDILEEASELCRGRRVPTWIWIKLMQVRLAKRAGREWKDRAREPLALARELRLSTRVQQFEGLGLA